MLAHLLALPGRPTVGRRGAAAKAGRRPTEGHRRTPAAKASSRAKASAAAPTSKASAAGRSTAAAEAAAEAPTSPSRSTGSATGTSRSSAAASSGEATSSSLGGLSEDGGGLPGDFAHALGGRPAVLPPVLDPVITRQIPATRRRRSSLELDSRTTIYLLQRSSHPKNANPSKRTWNSPARRQPTKTRYLCHPSAPQRHILTKKDLSSQGNPT
jgi:hypothetical protein